MNIYDNMDKQEVVYDYKEGRNTVPFSERYAFDVDKLINVGAIYITPSIDGDPNSPTYKQWINDGGSHLITLYNVAHSSPKSWIRKAVTEKGDTTFYKDNFIKKLYDGKYNQILWSLNKLNIDPNDMVIDNPIRESIKRILREESILSESNFFIRRINLEDIKKELKTNSTEVYYNTRSGFKESYKRFKYELTLKAVEAIMWFEYGIGWEDLPEQEEIDFVTKVSDIFGDYIKHLYDEEVKSYNS